MPVLLLGQQLAGIHSIVHEDYQAGKTMAEYAVALATDVIYLLVSAKMIMRRCLAEKGFLDVLAQTPNVKVDFIETSFSRREALPKALVFLKDQSATYIACATDNIAVAVKAAHELGYQVPQDFP